MSAKVSTTLALCVAAATAGCATRAEHYKSLLDLRDESSINYAQEIVNGIVGLRDRAELPTFFYVENAQSTWSPTVSGSIGGNYFLGLTNQNEQAGSSLAVTPSVSASTTLANSFTLQDFGSAAMSRVTGIYAFLVNPIHLGETELPHGALYAAVREQSSPDGLKLSKKTQQGTWIGVTPETQFEFFKLSRDVIYWSRHASPDPADLESAAGVLYGFFSQYPAAEVGLLDAVNASNKAAKNADDARAGYRAGDEAIRKLETDLRSANNPEVAKAILQQAYKRLDFAFDQMNGAGGDKQAAAAALTAQKVHVEALLESLRDAITLIKSQDPDGAKIDVEAAIKPFRRRVDGIISGDPEVLREVQYQLPSSHGINATETQDKLYRDRFESLPEQKSLK